MAKSHGLVDARVVFFKPEEASQDWAVTDIWKAAATIPGVTVQTDSEGREALNFRASTSGHVVLYDVNGQLLFSGGITEARGHMGDNDGRSAVVNLLRHGKSTLSATPVFGCTIQESAPPTVAIEHP
jgi:predicted heme/steroid binding protein